MLHLGEPELATIQNTSGVAQIQNAMRDNNLPQLLQERPSSEGLCGTGVAQRRSWRSEGLYALRHYGGSTLSHLRAFENFQVAN
jgi:hypothetical protein